MSAPLALSPRQLVQRRVALTLAITAFLLAFFHRVGLAVISADLVAAFDIGAARLGVLAATYFYVYMVMQVPTGVLADTLGPRRILAAGSAVAAAGGVVFAFAPTFEVAVAGRTLVGLGVSVAFIATLKLIAVWFEERRFASLVGLAMFLGNIGPVVAGAPLAWAAEAWSWRAVFAAVAAVSALIAIGSWLWVQDSPHGAATARVDRTAWLGGLLKVLRNRETWPGFFVNFGIAGSFFAFAGLWAVPYLNQVHGFSRAAASNHVSLYFLGFAIGCLFIGNLSDRIGRRKPLMVGGAVAHALGWWIWLSGIPVGGGVSHVACFGMGLLTASLSLSWACAKEVNPPLLSGMATSVVNVGIFSGPAVLQPLVGWVMDRGWDGTLLGGVRIYGVDQYRTGLWLMFGFALLGMMATLFVRETRCRNVWVEPRGEEPAR